GGQGDQMTAIGDRVSGVRFQGKAQEKAMKKTFVGLTLCVLLFALCPPVSAQQPTKIPRVVWLTTGSPSIITGRVEAFRQAMRELGYVEGKNILIESRGADNVQARRKAVAEELVHLRVDVIVTAGEGGTRAVKEATSTIPIVMGSDDDPVTGGVVASLRSEERRVGEEGRVRGGGGDVKKKREKE